MYLCAYFHRCILKATSPVTVPGVFRKVPSVSKISKTDRTLPAVALFCWSTLYILLHTWFWRLAFQLYLINWYASWRKKNIKELQFPKFLKLQHALTCFPFSYRWLTVERKRLFVCTKGWLQGEIVLCLNMDRIRSTWTPKMKEARPVSKIIFSLSLSFMKQVCGKKTQTDNFFPTLKHPFYKFFAVLSFQQ